MERSVNYFGVECELFWSVVSIILKRSVNYFDHFGAECFSYKSSVPSVILL
jgi:hypothetical protein